ncbi:MAG: hypothetical protein K8T10_13090 [Candidatus Eremiobacteraeota bacterium]|nr:hypothetical protein [Candidatus Eremiobacteraeota bacterium]
MKNDHFNFEYWLEIIYRRRKVFLSLVILALIAGIVIAIVSTPLYRAETSIYFPVSPRPMLPGSIPKGSDMEGMELGYAIFGQFAQPSIQDYASAMLKSRTMSDLVLDKYGEKLFPGRFKHRKRVQLREMMKKPIKILMGADNVIRITVETPDPKLSKEIANFYISEFKKLARGAILTTSKYKRIHLTKQRKIVRGNLQKYEQELASYEKAKQVVDPDTETKAAIENYGQLLLLSATTKAQQYKAERKLEALREKLKEQAKSFGKKDSYPSIKDQPVIQELYASLSSKELELLQARQIYTDEHPVVIDLKKDVSDLRSLIRKDIKSYLMGVDSNIVPRLIDAETEMLSLKAQAVSIDAFKEKQEEELGKIPDIRLKYNRLSRKVETTELILAMIEQEFEKARVEEARDDAEVQVMDVAVTPDYKSKPDVFYNLLLCVLFGIILGIMGVFFTEYANRVMDKMVS